MYNVFSGAFECVRPFIRQILSDRLTDSVSPSDRFCPSVRQMSLRPTDVRPSDRFAMGFLYLQLPKGEGKAPEGGHFASY